MPSRILLIIFVTFLVLNALSRALPPLRIDYTTPGYIIAYKDAHCTDYFNNVGESYPRGFYYYDNYPNCHEFNNVDFSGAENGNAPGYNVFWSAPDPDPGCKILILEKVSQQKSSFWECGNIVLAVEHAGCYETPALRKDFMLQFCCDIDCYNATGEYRAKRALEDSPQVVPLVNAALDRRGSKDLEDSSQSDAGVTGLARESGLKPSPFLLESRRKHRKKPKFHCNEPKALGDIFTRAGRQTRLTDGLQCDACTPCAQAVSPTVQVSRSVTNTKTTTFSDSESMDVSMEAGVDLIAGLAGSFGLEIGHSIAHAFGITDTTAVSKTVSETYSQPAGTNGFIWFTPTLTCQRKSLYCEGGPVKGITFEGEVCEPELKVDGSVLGVIGFESTD